jgi:hypothetical protein
MIVLEYFGYNYVGGKPKFYVIQIFSIFHL